MRQVWRYICDECQREHHSPEAAQRCDEQDLEFKASRKRALAEERKWKKRRHDVWHEDGGMKHAPKVDANKFGSHDYGDHSGTSDCSHGCGCWMGSAMSGGPVNPFGACPKNPKAPDE